MRDRIIMLIDFDYFFAQIEELRNPALKDKPLVVCVYSGRTEDSGAVSTANYAARKYGVKSGMPIVLAKKKLEGANAAFLPVDHELYDEVSERIMFILRSGADRFEQTGVDEAYVEVSRKANGSFEAAENLAQNIKEIIRKQEQLTCSIGIGPNKLIAKIAADSQKPDGLTIVRPEQVADFLSPLPVNRLIGVGTKTQEKMQSLGIGTVGDLARYDVQRLIEIFGRSLGVYFHNAAVGVDDEPVQERGDAESISRISTLKQNTRDLDIVLETTDRLCADVHEALRQRGLAFKSAGILAVMADMSVRGRSKTLETPSNDLDLLKRMVKELLERYLGETSLGVRRVGVKVSSFVRDEPMQKQITSFFELGEN